MSAATCSLEVASGKVADTLDAAPQVSVFVLLYQEMCQYLYFCTSCRCPRRSAGVSISAFALVKHVNLVQKRVTIDLYAHGLALEEALDARIVLLY
jgi:hypothetical protein